MCLAMSGRIELISVASPRESAREGNEGQGWTADGSEELDLWRIGLVDFGGVRQWVSLACLPEACLGDRVLVHVGMAIALEEEQRERKGMGTNTPEEVES
jgi:hydrogenase expression/formation protein HypC